MNVIDAACVLPHLSAPSLVYGFDLARNLQKLSAVVTHIEIVLFHTPECHNIPSAGDLRLLDEMAAAKGLTYSVHLPASLEIASENRRRREASRRQAVEWIHLLSGLNPAGYVLHVPMTPPTLTAEPGCYFRHADGAGFDNWTERTRKGLSRIQGETGLGRRLLVENINYSPTFLEPFWELGLCGFCLDIGHLLLGNEPVCRCLERYLPVIFEIHLHGVTGWEEHLALDVMPLERVRGWVDVLERHRFGGVVNLEVFDPRDLTLSLKMLNTIGWPVDGASTPQGQTGRVHGR